MAKWASDLVGSTPLGAVRTVSLAVRRYLLEFQPQGLVLAVSGGADSLALAACAIDLAGRMNIPTFSVTVDHGIRPGSEAEARQVAQLMNDLGADRALVASGVMPTGEGPESGARSLRYRLLSEAAEDFAGWKPGSRPVDILLGHTLDDQAETVLLRLARGASAAALAGIHRRRPVDGLSGAHWGRPLLALRREDTSACCTALGLEPVDDPTNRVDGPWRTADDQPLRRSAIREWALPALNRSLGQDVSAALARVAAQAQEDERALSLWAARVLSESETQSGLSAATLSMAPAAVRKRALRRWALRLGVPGGGLLAEHLERLDDLVVNWHGQGAVSLPGEVRVRRRGGFLAAD